MWIWIILAIVLVALAISIRGYFRVGFARKAGIEGVEDFAASQAYDRISQMPQFRFLRRMIVRELRKHNPNGTIVDAGCGPGYLVEAIAKSFPELHIIGVDISEEMMQVATLNLSSPGTGNRVEFRKGDVQKLPLEDNSVDFVVSTLSLHHWQHPEKALHEIHRALKPGGQFFIFDIRRDSRRFFYWLLCFARTVVVPAALRRINEPVGSLLAGYTPAEVEALLSGTPFRQWNIKPGFGWISVWGRKD